MLAISAMLLLSTNSQDVVLADPHDPPVPHTGSEVDGHIHYAENGDGMVRTFMSTDPETGAAVDWDVTGDDGDDFEISANGVLTFKESPDFEKPVDGLDANNDGDFEDAGEGDIARDNVYQIMVRATEQETPGDPTGRALSTEIAVTIAVDNEDEDGMVELNYLQPEVGTMITAMLEDEDLGAANLSSIDWAWSVSTVTNPDKDTEAHWANATGTVSGGTYIPTGVRAAAIDPRPSPDPSNAIDEGEYLRAKAMYTDTTGADKEAIGVSVNPVRAEVDSDSDDVENANNGSPGFPEGLDYTRSVPESTDMEMPVGAMVVAQDPNGDTLSYSLAAFGTTGTANFMDVDFFDIDRATGQISVAKMLDHEAEDGRPAAATAGEYKVVVTATDPSGESDNATVTITATDANDDPVIRGQEEITVMEQDSDDADDDGEPDQVYTGQPDMPVGQLNTNSNVYRASDDDDRGQITWSFKEDSNDPEAEDWMHFERSSTDLSGLDEPRALRFKTPPDYENPTDANRDNVYKVTLVATDGRHGGRDEFRISVFVENQQELGQLTLTASGDSSSQPFIGEPLTAMVSDPDGGVAVISWQWSRSSTKTGTYTPIAGATSATYTPVSGIADDPETTDVNETFAADEGMFLRATATYLDTTSDPDNPDTENIDERVQESGPTAKTAVTTDGTDANEDNVYRVMATTDKAVRVSPGGPGTTDPDMPDVAPTFDPGSYTGTVYENSEVGSLVTMSAAVSAGEGQALVLDPNRADDNKFFQIDMYGQIRVGEVDFRDPLPTGVQAVPSGAVAPGMEDPELDYENRTTYRLVVSATNDGGTSYANVVISLMDRNEHPYFDQATREIDLDTATDGFDRTIEYREGSTNRRVDGLAAVEPDGDSLNWEVVGTDSADFEIVDAPDGAGGKDRVELRFRANALPDYERPMDRDEDPGTAGDQMKGDNMYKIMVRVTEAATVGANVPPKAVELDLTVSVTNAEEDGMVQLKWRQPEVGTPISASLTDPDSVADNNVDGDVTTGVTYSWFRAKVRNPDRNIDPDDVPDAGTDQWEPLTDNGAQTATYTPQGKTPDDPDTPADEETGDEQDEGWHLLVRATYPTDQVAIGISEYRVRANVHDNSNNSPDFNAAKATRTVREDIGVDMPVGAVVDVDRNEDNDVLTYELVDSDIGNDGNPDVDAMDLAFFYIEPDSGQIKVKKGLNFEGHDDSTTVDVEPSEYTVVVRATDPSGETLNEENRDDITVVITVTDINEAPKVTDGYSIIQVNEMNESKKSTDNGQYYIGLGNTASEASPYTVTENANQQNYYKVSDEDPVDSHRWPDNFVPGPDGRWFEYSTPQDGISRRLHFIDPPDYENPQDRNGDNVYEVWVTAIDNGNVSGYKAVRIDVLNVQEEGELTLEPAEPEEDDVITATLTDPDGEVVITDWMWAQNSASGGTFAEADMEMGKTTATFTGDVGSFVWSQVHYRDGASVVDDPVTALDERNDDPETDNNTEQHKYRNLNADGTPYGGDNSFHNSDEMLDKVTDTAVQEPSTGPGAGDPGDTTGDPTGPPSVINVQRMVPENTPSTGYVGAPLAADEMPGMMTGPDANDFAFAEDEDNDNQYYDSVLAPSNDIDDKVGQLALVPVRHLDFESSKNSYSIEFSEGEADSEVIRVTILVTDVNEAPSMPVQARGGLQITGSSNIPSYNENGDEAVGSYGTTGAGTSATVRWWLSGDDLDDLSINADGELTFNMDPDYEMPTDANSDNIYSITVEADDGTNQDSLFVTITVGNMDEDGTVTLSTYMPSAGGTITATVEDPDGMVANEMWQWSRAEAVEGPYTDIMDATDNTYTPMAAVEDDPATMEDEADPRDEGMFLRATASYEDGEGRGKMASGNTTTGVGVIPDNGGMVTFSPSQPVAGTPLTAMLRDADLPITMLEWQWASSDDMDGTFTDIIGATAASYTPREAVEDDPMTIGVDETSAGDVGMYLQATAMYNDSHGDGKSAMMVTTNAVITAPVDMCIAPLGTLTASETVMGTWASDCMSSTAMTGRYAQYYTFTLASDMQVEMNLTSATDPYLVLREGEGRTGGLVTSNDNVGSRNFNSAINMMLDAGTYTVEATTFFAGQTGDFTLSVRPLQETEDLGTLAGSVDRSNSMWVSDYVSTQQAGSYARSYTFTVNTATHVAIDLTSPEDSYLYVLDSNGAVVHESDNVTDRNLNSRIDETLAAGMYTIEATTYFPARMGTFHLSIGVLP